MAFQKKSQVLQCASQNMGYVGLKNKQQIKIIMNTSSFFGELSMFGTCFFAKHHGQIKLSWL